MDVRRRSVNKYDAKKLFVTKALDNNLSNLSVHTNLLPLAITSHGVLSTPGSWGTILSGLGGP